MAIVSHAEPTWKYPLTDNLTRGRLLIEGGFLSMEASSEEDRWWLKREGLKHMTAKAL
jgi:hypothetical protein